MHTPAIHTNIQYSRTECRTMRKVKVTWWPPGQCRSWMGYTSSSSNTELQVEKGLLGLTERLVVYILRPTRIKKHFRKLVLRITTKLFRCTSWITFQHKKSRGNMTQFFRILEYEKNFFEHSIVVVKKYEDFFLDYHPPITFL